MKKDIWRYLEKYKYVFIFILVILLILGRIIYVNINRKEIQGEPPAKKLEFYKHYITVKPVEGAKPIDFFNIDFFKGFYPNITFEEAINKFGVPDNIREEKNKISHEYWRNNGRIEIVREEYVGGIDWGLYFYPRNLNYGDLLVPTISNYIDLNKKNTSIQIENSLEELAYLVYLEGNRVEFIIWYR